MSHADPRPIATVRHVSASGRLDAFWEWDPARRLLMGQIQVGAAPPVVLPDGLDDPLRIHLSTDKDGRRAFGSWCLTRRGAGDVFLVMPARFLRDGSLEPVPLHPNLPMGPVLLISAPPVVFGELLSLFEPDAARTTPVPARRRP